MPSQSAVRIGGVGGGEPEGRRCNRSRGGGGALAREKRPGAAVRGPLLLLTADTRESVLRGGASRHSLGRTDHTEQRFRAQKHGLVCALTGSHGFTQDFVHAEEHAGRLTVLRERIDATAAAGFPIVITFSGFRGEISDEAGTKNVGEERKKIAGSAERKRDRVT